MNPNEFVHNTAYSVQLPYIAGLSLNIFVIGHLIIGHLIMSSILTGFICPVVTHWLCAAKVGRKKEENKLMDIYYSSSFLSFISYFKSEK